LGTAIASSRGLVDKLGNVKVNLADGSESTLGSIRRRAEQGVGVFFGVAHEQALNQIMQARGHLAVLLSSDRHRQDAERRFLEQYCAAKPCDGIIDCTEHYTNLSRYERVFLSELELNISKSYEVKNFRLIPGKLTEDMPVFIKEHGGSQPIDVFVDVRHQEIAKLEDLGYSQLLYSLISTFCREYLGPSLKKWSPRFFGDGALNLELLAKRRSELWVLLKALKKWSPRFFGDGALNLELLAKRRSELWVLLKGDIGVVRKGGQRQVVTRSDVRVVNVGGGGQSHHEQQPGRTPSRILHIVDEQGATGLGGFYIRLPDTAFGANGDLLPQVESSNARRSDSVVSRSSAGTKSQSRSICWFAKSGSSACSKAGFISIITPAGLRRAAAMGAQDGTKTCCCVLCYGKL